MAELARLEEVLEHRFADAALLTEALTHPSVDRPKRRSDYDRLEFLGDRVLGLIIATHLFRRFPRAKAGDLAQRYNALVCQDCLARIATGLHLGSYIRLSRSEKVMGGAKKPAILADVLEAVIAALYLDGGAAVAERFVLARFTPLIDDLGPPGKDAKTALQEWAQGHGLTPPTYRLAEYEGPAHAPRFVVTAELAGGAAAGGAEARGEGGSKREAEQTAAARLLAALGAAEPMAPHA
jgi:ribonuclease-3